MLPVNLNNFLLGSRFNGYKLYEGAAEIIDNSIQAGATYVDIHTISRGKNVDCIMYADNGCGMDISTLHSYLRIGESSSFLADSGISKFGVGAKLGAYNIGKRIDVWSRVKGTDEFYYTYYDLDDVAASSSIVELHPPTQHCIPQEYLLKIPADVNTLVVWSKLDKWPTQSFNAVQSDVCAQLGRIFRKFIHSGFELSFNGYRIKHFDPSLRLTGSYNDEILSVYYGGENAPIKHFEPTFICKDEVLMELDGDVVTLSVSLAPPSVTRKAGQGGDSLARSLRLRANQGMVSFMRSHREVGYSLIPNLFPRAVKAEDRFISVTVEFTPKFDEDFDVRVVKRGIEPQGKLREILQARLQSYIPIASKLLQKQWDDESTTADFEEIEQAIERLNQSMLFPMSDAAGPIDAAQKRIELLKLASEIGLDNEQQEDYCAKKSQRPFVLQRVENLGTDFIDFCFSGDQVIIRINESHSIFKTVWQPLYDISQMKSSELDGSCIDPVETARHSLEALNLMLISFGRRQSLVPVDSFSDTLSGWSTELERLIGQVKG